MPPLIITGLSRSLASLDYKPACSADSLFTFIWRGFSFTYSGSYPISIFYFLPIYRHPHVYVTLIHVISSLRLLTPFLSWFALVTTVWRQSHLLHRGQGWYNLRLLHLAREKVAFQFSIAGFAALSHSLLHISCRFSLPCFFFGICISNAQHVDTYKRYAHEVGTARLVGMGSVNTHGDLSGSGRRAFMVKLSRPYRPFLLPMVSTARSESNDPKAHIRSTHLTTRV